MSRSAWLAGSALLIAIILITMQIRNGTATKTTDGVQVVESGSSSKVDGPSSATRELESASPRTDKAPSPRSDSAHPKIVDPRFHQWLVHEAKSLDSPSVNGERKKKEIREIVQKLTPAQSRQLLATAQDPQAPAGEKILSTYLLVEGGSISREDLRVLITSPVEDQGPHQAHSESEMTGVREKSLRIMALDGLFSRAQSDPSAREALAKIIADIQDPYVREYARERYSRLRSQ
jgi:hypothetical protein